MKNDDRSADTGQGSKLDLRRERLQSAKAAAEGAQKRLRGLDDQLAANETQTREHESALRAASDEVTRRKKALKASAKKQQQLGASRNKVVALVAKARQKAHGAEVNYDKAVLADMVRRERDRDLAAHGRGGNRTASSSAKPSVDPPPERPALGTKTATETAARKTAAAADRTNYEPGSSR